ncbi:Uncharacterised protein [Mycobacteroides abscessus]|nr:Uncharacterised protein [Mycobacteroides abscessus]
MRNDSVTRGGCALSRGPQRWPRSHTVLLPRRAGAGRGRGRAYAPGASGAVDPRRTSSVGYVRLSGTGAPLIMSSSRSAASKPCW